MTLCASTIAKLMAVAADRAFIVYRKAANLLMTAEVAESYTRESRRTISNERTCRESWIGGTISIDKNGVFFETNRVNALVCGATVEHAMLWQHVVDVRYRFGWVSGIIEIIPAFGQTMTFRCFRAKSLASAMRLHLVDVKNALDAELA